MKLDLGAFARLVVDLPPQKWSELRKRLDVLEQYRRLEEPTSADAAHFGAKINLGERSFYRLARALNAKPCLQTLSDKRGLPRDLGNRVEQHIQETIADLGMEARTSDVYAEVVYRCERDGIAPPSVMAITTRLDDEPYRPDVSRHLRRLCHVVLDTASLLLTVTADGEKGNALLSAAINARSGIITSHQLNGAVRTPEFYLNLLRSGHPGKAETSEPRYLRLIQTAGVPAFDEHLRTRLGSLGFELDPRTRGLPPGIALRAIFGRRIGRTRIMSSQAGVTRTGAPIVELEDARAVLKLLVDRRNARTLERSTG